MPFSRTLAYPPSHLLPARSLHPVGCLPTPDRPRTLTQPSRPRRIGRLPRPPFRAQNSVTLLTLRSLGLHFSPGLPDPPRSAGRIPVCLFIRCSARRPRAGYSGSAGTRPATNGSRRGSRDGCVPQSIRPDGMRPPGQCQQVNESMAPMSSLIAPRSGAPIHGSTGVGDVASASDQWPVGRLRRPSP
jgi:hypothetical protein